jgi:hypothetical protein
MKLAKVPGPRRRATRLGRWLGAADPDALPKARIGLLGRGRIGDVHVVVPLGEEVARPLRRSGGSPGLVQSDTPSQQLSQPRTPDVCGPLRRGAQRRERRVVFICGERGWRMIEP